MFRTEIRSARVLQPMKIQKLSALQFFVLRSRPISSAEPADGLWAGLWSVSSGLWAGLWSVNSGLLAGLQSGSCQLRAAAAAHGQPGTKGAMSRLALDSSGSGLVSRKGRKMGWLVRWLRRHLARLLENHTFSKC